MDNLKEIKTGDILLVSSQSWLARQIKLFQQCEWNHAGVMWWAYDKLFVIEADKYGICCTPFEDYYKSNKKLMILQPYKYIDGSKIGEMMLPYIGHTPYNFTNLLFSQPIKLITGIWLGKKGDKAAHRMVCSEWCAYIYNRYFGKGMFDEWWKIAPKDLFYSEIFEKHLIEK
jgi:hypothetical protein